jgi:uncharacterized protein YbaP (TraB family)
MIRFPRESFDMLIRLALLAAAAALSAPAQSAAPVQAAPAAAPLTDADPALWVVKDEDTTIYLFGTVHVLKPGLSWFDEAVKAAFDASDELVLEINQPDPATMQPLMMRLGFDTTGTPLSQTLPGDKGAAYLKAMAAAGIPTATAEHFKPWLAATILSLAPLEKSGYVAANGPEAVLTAAATKAGKTLGELETAEQQLGYLAGLSTEAQTEFLTSTLDELPKAGETMATMVADWSNGKPKALGALLNANITSPELKKTLLTDRNARWADWVTTRLETPGTVFVAVGAGHLSDIPGSVQADLRAKHVTVTRVAY